MDGVHGLNEGREGQRGWRMKTGGLAELGLIGYNGYMVYRELEGME